MFVRFYLRSSSVPRDFYHVRAIEECTDYYYVTPKGQNRYSRRDYRVGHAGSNRVSKSDVIVFSSQTDAGSSAISRSRSERFSELGVSRFSPSEEVETV